MLDKWRFSNCDDRWLLNEQALQDARTWAGVRSLSEEHHQFLMRSQSHIHEQEMTRQDAMRKREQTQTMEQANAIATRRIVKLKQQLTISLVLCGILLLAIAALVFTR